jgi:hypothetical protein
MLVSGSCPDSRSQQLVPANEVRDFRDEGAFEAFHPDRRAYDPSLWRSLREPETNGTPVQVATMVCTRLTSFCTAFGTKLAARHAQMTWP